jgi:predicted HAD superfamily phosphohydrolase YqeG
MMTYHVEQQAERERLAAYLEALRQDQLDRWFVSNELSKYRVRKAREDQQLECVAKALRGDGEE